LRECFLDLCAHVAGYEAIIKRWEKGDYSTIDSILNYPGTPYVHHLRESFTRLKNASNRSSAPSELTNPSSTSPHRGEQPPARAPLSTVHTRAAQWRGQLDPHYQVVGVSVHR
jgi:hypothetical protein